MSALSRAPRVTLLNGLVAYYKLEEASGTRVDSSGNGRDLTILTGAPTNVAAKVSNGLKLVATGTQWVSMADDANLSFSESFSIGAWIQIDTQPASMVLTNKGNSGGFQFAEYMLRFVGGGSNIMQAKVGNATSSVSLNSVATVATGTPVFVGMAVDTGGAQKIYIHVDDQPVVSAACTIKSYDSAFGLRVGREVGTNTNYWDGYIDELGFWNRMLSNREWKYLKAARRPIGIL